MTEYFRIEGLKTIDFDAAMVVPGTIPIYNLSTGRPPTDLGKPMTRGEILSNLARLPLGVRGHALNRGMSMVTFPFDIQADKTVANPDAQMEQALHDLKRTLNEGQLHIESEGARGTQMVLHYKSDGAVQHSYKTIYYGYLAEAGARDVLGPRAKENFLQNLQITLYMEPMWRPSAAVMLGPNEIYCPGFEEDGNADGLADNWVLVNAPTATMESTIVLQGFYSQKLVTGAFANRGIQSATFVAPAATASAVCYAWLCRPAAGSNIIVELYDNAGAVVASALYNTVGWETETAKDGIRIFKRVVVSTAAGIVPGNTYRMRIYNTTDTPTTYYVDKCFWKWGTVTAPDEWADHWLVYNHYDTTEGAAHVGHQNYFDVSDLNGTDDVRLLLRAEPWVMADLAYGGDLLIARRSQFDYPGDPVIAGGNARDIHWLEAEDGAYASNWAAAALARCSAGNCVTNAGAAVAGYRGWTFPQAPPWALTNYADQIRGRWDVFGVVYTNDIVNTQYRLSYTNLGQGLRFYNPWVKQTTVSTWQQLYLGEINIDQFLRAGFVAGTVDFYVEYAKDNGDTVSLDCVWLMPKTDPQSRLHNIDLDWLVLAQNQFWTMQRTTDFDSEDKEAYAAPYSRTLGELCLQGDVMIAKPDIDQRFYFCCESASIASAVRSYEAHGAATNLQFKIHIDCLPQYQTPLD